MKHTLTLLMLIAAGLPAAGQQDMSEEWTSKCYVVDNVPIAKTPQFLGLNVEVMKFANRANIWDWLADSNADMVRAPHPATLMRRSYKEEPAVLEPFKGISNKEGFDAFRERLRGDPKKVVPASSHRKPTREPCTNNTGKKPYPCTDRF